MTLLEVRGLSKTFPGQVALDDVDLDLKAGCVLALSGQNGSGKSTLIKVLSGYHYPDPGARVAFAGERVSLNDRTAPWRRHVRFIHQDLGLVPGLDTLDNMALGTGYDTDRVGRIRWRREERRARRLLDEFGVDVDVRKPVARLSAVERTIVAGVRALRGWDSERGVLILDEPTAALTAVECERLFAVIRRVARRGAAVLFVTHRLDEVFDLADRVAVLRDGRLVEDCPVSALDEPRLVGLITGRPLEALYTAAAEPQRKIVMAVRGITGTRLREVSFDLRAGEVLGVAGLDGSGREELPGMLFGVNAPTSGTLEVDGVAVAPGSPRRAMAHGLALVPADRAVRGVVGEFTVQENVTLAAVPARWRRGPIDARADRREAAEWIARIGVRPADPSRQVARLSGGNQQKVVLARWLRTAPRVLLLDEPTQGVDVGAKAGIYRQLAGVASAGVGVLVSSSDSEELAHMCDRVLVLRAGRVAGELKGDALTAGRVEAELLRSDRKAAA